jgi:hypothetical protein
MAQTGTHPHLSLHRVLCSTKKIEAPSLRIFMQHLPVSHINRLIVCLKASTYLEQCFIINFERSFFSKNILQCLHHNKRIFEKKISSLLFLYREGLEDLKKAMHFSAHD